MYFHFNLKSKKNPKLAAILIFFLIFLVCASSYDSLNSTDTHTYGLFRFRQTRKRKKRNKILQKKILFTIYFKCFSFVCFVLFIYVRFFSDCDFVTKISFCFFCFLFFGFFNLFFQSINRLIDVWIDQSINLNQTKKSTFNEWSLFIYLRNNKKNVPFSLLNL